MNPEYRLIHTSWQNNKTALGDIRRRVFIEEQHVPKDLEWDGLDESCHHILVTDSGNRPIGTGRIKSNGHIGRMAVLDGYRNQGVGSAILMALLEYARQQQYSDVYLHAQVSAIPFYVKHGFVINSEQFMDAGIPHRGMAMKLTSS